SENASAARWRSEPRTRSKTRWTSLTTSLLCRSISLTMKQTATPAFATLDADPPCRDRRSYPYAHWQPGEDQRTREPRGRSVRSMLEHSRGTSSERRLVNLNTLVDEALNRANHSARAQDQSFNVTLQRHFDEGITPITVVPQDVTRVLLNLFSNG